MNAKECRKWQHRHGCYLVVLSSDGSKPAVALGKTYFAITTDELGVKITLEPVQDDFQFTLASVDVPIPGAKYTSLDFAKPVSTLIHLYWLPQVPDDRTCAVVMAALAAYLTTIIQDNEPLNALYGGKSPFTI